MNRLVRTNSSFVEQPRSLFDKRTAWIVIFYALLLSSLSVREVRSSPISHKNVLLDEPMEFETDQSTNATIPTKFNIGRTWTETSSADKYSTESEMSRKDGIRKREETNEGSTLVTWPAHLTPLYSNKQQIENTENITLIPTHLLPNHPSDDLRSSSGDITNDATEVNFSQSTILPVHSSSEVNIGVTEIFDSGDKGESSSGTQIGVTSVSTIATQNVDDDRDLSTENTRVNTKSTFHGIFFPPSNSNSIGVENGATASHILSSSSNTRSENKTETKPVCRISYQDGTEGKTHRCKIMYPNGTIVIQAISDVLASATPRKPVELSDTDYDDIAGTTESSEHPVLYTDPYGKPITEQNGDLTYIDKCGRPVTQSRGNSMFTDKHGNPVTDRNGNVIYVDKAGHPVTDSNGMAVYTDSSGKPILDSEGNPIYTDSCKNPITDNKGRAISTDSAGRPVYTDSSGKALTDADGNGLFTDKNGRLITDCAQPNVYTDCHGKPVYTYKNGKPITNNKGNPIYTDSHGNPILTSPMSPYDNHTDEVVFDYDDVTTEINVDYEDTINKISKDKMKAAEKMTKCNIKTINNTDVVCVCNKTYCDKFLPIHRVPAGQYLWFSSSKSGSRFDKKTGEFTKQSVIKRSADVFSIDINNETQLQRIIGFGSTFTESASEIIKKLSSRTRNHLLESYFGYFGIRYTLGRVPIGCSEFSSQPCTYMDDSKQKIGEFQVTRQDHKYKMPVIATALDMTNDELKLIGSAWTAPKWTKTMCSLKDGGALRREYWSFWAKYHIQFLNKYLDNKDRPIKFWALSTGNKAMDIDNTGMQWSPYQLQQWVTHHLVPELRNSSHSDILILAFDDNREYLPFYIKWFFENFEGKKYKDLQCMKVNEAYEDISGIALHWYTDTEKNLKYLDYVHDLYPDKFLIYTEASCRPFEMASWDCAERYALDIISNLNNWVTGWMDLNLALNVRGGPNWRNDNASATIIVNEKRDEFYKQPSYYVMGHFSKFILPHSHRIKIPTTVIKNVSTVVVKRPDNGTAIIFYNENDHEENVTFVIDQRRIFVQTEAKSINSILFWN